MKPNKNAARVLSITRAKAKMHEYAVPGEHHISLPHNPNLLFSLAIGLLGDAAANIAYNFVVRSEIDSVTPPEEHTFDGAWISGDDSIRSTSQESLRFAATYFDAFLDTRLDDSISTEFSLLCSCAYDLAGSPGSALVVAKRMDPPPLDLGSALAFFIHALLLERYLVDLGESWFAKIANRILLSIREFFDGKSSEAELQTLCHMLRSRAYADGESRELLYADIAVAIISRRLASSSRRCLPPSSGLDFDLWQPALQKTTFPRQLWPAQQRICDSGLLKGRSAVVQMPTSAGKTRAIELIIRSSFLSERTSLAVVVAPFRSLCHEIRNDLASAFHGENVDLDEATDTFSLDLDFDDIFSRTTVLILTPEKLLYILRREPSFAAEIGLIIYDEGHQFDGFSRGPTYELLLTSLKIALRPETQVVFISAVIGNAPVIAQWLVGDSTAVVDGGGLLATPKSIAFASWQDARGKLQYVSPLDPEEDEFFVPRVIELLPLARKIRERNERNFPERTGPEIGLYLSLQLARNGSSAVFCGRKDSASGICERVVEIFDRDVSLIKPREFSDAGELDKIAALIRLHLGQEALAAKAAEIGVLQHHGNVPQGLRLSIEHAMKVGASRIVACTSTLAQGVNFPIKYLIVTTLHQGLERISVRDFHNLIGRAGRAGMHTEGSIIFASPDIYDERSTGNRWKWAGAKDLLNGANAEPCGSAILSLLEPFRQKNPDVIQDIPPEIYLFLVFATPISIGEVANAFTKSNPSIKLGDMTNFLERQARIVQNIAAYIIAHEDPDVGSTSDDIIRLVGSTLAYSLADEASGTKLVEIFQIIFKSISENATSADRRAIIRKSPLAPSILFALETWMAEHVDDIREAIEASRIPDLFCEVIIRHMSNNTLMSLSTNDHSVTAFHMWRSGRPFCEIYEIFNTNKVKVGRRFVTRDDVVALCESGFGFEAAMIAASASDLAEDIDESTQRALASLQRSLRYGLSSETEIALYEAGFADRVVVARIASYFEGVSTRSGVRSVCRAQCGDLETEISCFPSYFTKTLYELAG